MDRCEVHWAGTVQSEPSIATYECWLKGASPRESDWYTKFHGPSEQSCAGAPIYNGWSMGEEDCRSKCTLDTACKFYGIWPHSHDGQHWCALTSACSGFVPTPGFAVTVYTKGSTHTRASLVEVWRHGGARFHRRGSTGFLSRDAVLLQADASRALARDPRALAAEL
uniref:Apple domain-containing protein n=1 Tax=Zooxanthella nutricula TaxID=1333877 RepID=A0A7S2PGF3_9DINO